MASSRQSLQDLKVSFKGRLAGLVYTQELRHDLGLLTTMALPSPSSYVTSTFQQGDYLR